VGHRPLSKVDQLVAYDGSLLRLEDQLTCGREENPLQADCFRETLLPAPPEKIEGVEKLDIPGSLGKRQAENTIFVGIQDPPGAGPHQAATPGPFDLRLLQKGMVSAPGANSQGGVGKSSPIRPQQPERNKGSPAQVDLETSTQEDGVGGIRRHLYRCPLATRILPAVKNADPWCIARVGNLHMNKEPRVFGLDQGKIEGAIAAASVEDRSQGREPGKGKICCAVKPGQPHAGAGKGIAID
jgi:hypothetical protein